MQKRNVFTWVLVVSSLLGCGDDESPKKTGRSNGAVSGVCQRVCSHFAAAKCSQAEPLASCVADCENDYAQTPVRCEPQIDAFARCAENGRVSCTASGQPLPEECVPLWSAYQECLASAPAPSPQPGDAGAPSSPSVPTPSLPSHPSGPSNPSTPSVPVVPAGPGAHPGSRPDAGLPSGNPSTTPSSDSGVPAKPLPPAVACAPLSDDTSCDRCFKRSCCEELSACGPDCQMLGACLSECTDESCLESCLTEWEEGYRVFEQIGECAETSCESECSEEVEPSPTSPSSGSGSPAANAGKTDICLDTTIPDGICTESTQPFGYDCPLGKPFPDCALVPGIANVYCCSR